MFEVNRIKMPKPITKSLYTLDTISNPRDRCLLFALPLPSPTRFQHLPYYPHQLRILQRSSHPLLIPQLLIDLVSCTMRTLLDPNVDSEPRRKRLLQTNPYSEPNSRGKRAVCNRRRNLNKQRL